MASQFVSGNLELPSNWTEMAESEFVKLVNLASGSSEFQEVKNLMLSTAQNKLKGIHKVSATHCVRACVCAFVCVCMCG